MSDEIKIRELYKTETRTIERNLKPCPFCGGRVMKLEVTGPTGEADDGFYGEIICQYCGVHVSFDDGAGWPPQYDPGEGEKRFDFYADELAEQWNHRSKGLRH